METELNLFRQRKEAKMVAEAYAKDLKAVTRLYDYCETYFFDHYRGIFFTTDEVAGEIMQNCFIVLWEHIENRRIYAKEQRLYGPNGKPLTAGLLTYFMGIAKYKYKEWLRSINEDQWADDSMFSLYFPGLYDEPSTENEAEHYWRHRQLEIIEGILADMSKRCYEILTKFYYESKDLDCILREIPSITNKDSLKTKKYKCMETLRTTAQQIYLRELNA